MLLLPQSFKIDSFALSTNFFRCKFINEFSRLPDTTVSFSNKMNKERVSFDVSYGNPIQAVSICTMLKEKKSGSFLFENRQEDAEEFLGLLLNGLNDEMINVSVAQLFTSKFLVKLFSQEESPL